MSSFLAKINVLVFFVFFILVSSAFSFSKDEKLKPEDIIAKHLESIGSPEKRGEARNQFLLCNLQSNTTGTNANFDGKAVIFSSYDKNIWGLIFNSPDYPSDKFGFDSKDVKVAFVRPGVRSLLGDFLLTYNKLLEESLLGGVLLKTWVFQNNSSKNPKLKYSGTKKINEKDTYAISYTPKGGSDLEIKLYFDQQNFQHIRTEYSRIIAGGLAGIDNSAGQGASRIKLTEDFSDFKKMGDLMLPGNYKINYMYLQGSNIQNGANRNRDVEWKFNVVNFSFNQTTDDKSFDVNAN